jgi:hypothetical protein
VDDQGLNSAADLKMLERVLIAGLVAVIITGFVAFIFTGNWWLLLLTIGPYALIAGSQWAFAAQRGRRTEHELQAELDANEQ